MNMSRHVRPLCFSFSRSNTQTVIFKRFQVRQKKKDCMCLLICMIIIFIHEEWLSLNLNKRAAQPFCVYWKHSQHPMSSSSHKRNIKGAVLPFIESVFSSVPNCFLFAFCCCSLFFFFLSFFLRSLIFIFSFPQSSVWRQSDICGV